MHSLEFLKYIYFLTRVKNLGNIRIKNLLSYFETPYDFYNSSANQLRQIDGIDSGISEEIISARNKKDSFGKEFELLITNAEKKKINIVCITDDDYPENLKKIFDAPVLLYYKGKLNKKDKFSLSIVGTRNPTEYGKYTTEKFTEQFCELGIPIISGFARGIDSIAHKTCLRKNNLTYAVFGCGVDIIYPEEHIKFYRELIEKGAVISEFSIGVKPEKVNFPKRNRIISGISIGTLVIESGIRGGAVLTAEFALDQDKEVFAIPGYINSKQSEGVNELIKKGQAKLVTNIDDILNELDLKLKPILKREATEKEQTLVKDLNVIEKTIYSAINFEPIHIDKLNEVTGLSISDCLVNLLSLEFKGLIRQIPGKNFMRI